MHKTSKIIYKHNIVFLAHHSCTDMHRHACTDTHMLACTHTHMYVHSGAQQEHDEVGRGTGDKRKMTEFEIICILFAEVSFEGTGG